MGDLFYRPDHAWVGDLIPYYEDGMFYAFYLHDPRLCPDKYAENTTWHLVTTKDFKNLSYHGEAIHPGCGKQPDKNAYTGSVIRNTDGIYYAFFTAFNEEICLDGKPVQSVMRATGKDLYHLETDREFLLTADGRMYEPYDWRDPYVFFHEGEQCWWMLLAARKKGGGELRGGCIALCKSEDLTNWTWEKPFFEPQMYVTMECPEVFRMGDYWYFVFSTFSDRFVTHYRIAKQPEGPWMIPEDDVFDTRVNYAIKTASDGEKRYAFGWLASRKGNRDFGSWEWGGTMIFHELVQNPSNGALTVKPIQAYLEHYPCDAPVEEPEFWNCRKTDDGEGAEAEMLGAILYELPEDCFLLDVRFTIDEASEFGLALHVSEGLERGYFLKMLSRNAMMAWDQWPRAEKGFYQWQIKGEIPFQPETVRRLPEGPDYHVRVLREKDICVVYVNDEVALSARMYD
ncbi:MAG: beta-fructofuranosidase, partial [Clostridiales bacterium]|nr:beta-fructofuranosidase [Clostridiales bacterium]